MRRGLLLAGIVLVLAGLVFGAAMAPTSGAAQDDAPATIAALQTIVAVQKTALAVEVTRVAQQRATISALQTQIAGAPSQAAPAATTAPTGAPAGALLQLNGSGTTTTQTFTVVADWDLAWTYDCSGFLNGTGNFQVFVYNADGSISLDNNIVNQLGSTGASTEHYHTGGSFYLVVNSECDWTIAVTPA